MTPSPRPPAPRDPFASIAFPHDRDRLAAARQYTDMVSRRRSVRSFSGRSVDPHIIQTAIAAAHSAPSGANAQPWHFAVIESLAMKRRIREAAEAEERAFYESRAPRAWLDALAPIGTDASKPYLDMAPYLIAVFYEAFGGSIDERQKRYYPVESVGIATGMLISALTAAGLATLTHTPSPMRFLCEILKRPPGERPFVLLVVGHPADDATVPRLDRKTIDAVSSWW